MPKSLALAAIAAASLVLPGLAGASIITYRFTGQVLEAPVQLTDLAYNSGPNPLVFTIVVNDGIPAEATGPYGATYAQAVQSITVELGGQLIATAATGQIGITTDDQAGTLPGGGRQAFQAYVPNPGDFTSGPVLGLTPKKLESNFMTGFGAHVFASTALPVPFPPQSVSMSREVRLTFESPATQPLYALLRTTTTTAVVPVPAAAWLLGGALGLLPLVRRRAAPA